MTEALVLYVYMILAQQVGITGGAGADKAACDAARTAMIQEMKDLGQDIIAASECEKFTLQPYARQN